MVYRVILLSNGVYKSTLYRCMTRTGVFINYHKIKEKNKVLFPKQFANYNGLIPVEYQIAVTKVTEEGDTFRNLRNKYGKTYTEPPLGDWTILDSSDYDIEEKFWIYGLNSKINRPTINEIIKRLAISAHATNVIKQVIVVNNKLVIYNEDQFEMVICKCLADAQRLHHTLFKVARKQRIKNIIFMGTATPASKTMMYKIMGEKTGWSIKKISRTTTTP